VCLGVGLGGFRSMVGGMEMVPVGYMRMVRRLLMVAGFMVLGGFLVVTGRVLVMLSGFDMVLRSFFRHG